MIRHIVYINTRDEHGDYVSHIGTYAHSTLETAYEEFKELCDNFMENIKDYVIDEYTLIYFYAYKELSPEFVEIGIKTLEEK